MHNKEKKSHSNIFQICRGIFCSCFDQYLPIMVVPIILFYNNFLQNLNIIWRVIFLMHQVALHCTAVCSQRTMEPCIFLSCNLNIIKYNFNAVSKLVIDGLKVEKILVTCKVQSFWEGHKFFKKIPLFLTSLRNLKKEMRDVFWNCMAFSQYQNFTDATSEKYWPHFRSMYPSRYLLCSTQFERNHIGIKITFKVPYVCCCCSICHVNIELHILCV